MRVFINECSFPERTTDSDQVYAALEQLIKMYEHAKTFCNNQQILRHRDLKNKEVMPGISLIEYIISLGKHPDPKRSKAKVLFLELFAKSPFLQGTHEEGESVTDKDGNCLKLTCFDDASSFQTGAAVMSVSSNKAEKHFAVQSSKYGHRSILNLHSAQQIQDLLWIYEDNPKHVIPADKIENGEVHSAMPLTKTDAQKVLSNGVMFGKSVFNVIDGQWYKFHSHKGNIYHGFPIAVSTPYKEYSAAAILFEAIVKNEDGQIYGDMCQLRGNCRE